MSDRERTAVVPAELRSSALSAGVSRGVVSGLGNEGITVVIEPHDEPREITCDLLDSALRPGEPLTVGDTVLVWSNGSANARGVVVGRVVAPRVEITGDGPVASAPPATRLALEADERLTLRVGEGSVEMRADGRVLIKGTDVVSHAGRMNRIKGGAVSIN